MLENLTELLLPGLLLTAGAAGLRRKRDVYGDLLVGAQDGLRLLATLAPSLVLMLAAVTMLRESGFFDWLTPLAAPVFRVLGIPPELAPLVLIRPLSGSAALAVGTELMQRYGVDSLMGGQPRSCSARRRQRFIPSASTLAPRACAGRATLSRRR
ncbi:MAG: nucleoside recognition domain-containing protein [Oscillospiraceae bacterium]